MADLVGGSALGLVFAEFWSAVKEAKDRVKDFKPKLRDLESTLGDLAPRIEDIERINIQLNESAQSEVERLKLIMEEGKELISKCLDVSRWNIIKKSCYQKKLVELESKIIRFNSQQINLCMFMEVKHLRLQVNQLSNEVQSQRSCIQQHEPYCPSNNMVLAVSNNKKSPQQCQIYTSKLCLQVNQLSNEVQSLRSCIQQHEPYCPSNNMVLAVSNKKSPQQCQICTSKLIQELDQLNISGGSAPPREKAVGKAANRVVALTATRRTFTNKAPAQKSHQEDQIWKSQVKFRIYTSKLLQELVQLDITGVGVSGGGPPRGKVVREAADRALALTANGTTRWSRAILANRVNRGLQRKVRFLSELVPGCRNQPLRVVLEEAMDYISALNMQVRAMTALADLLSASSSSSSATFQIQAVIQTHC